MSEELYGPFLKCCMCGRDVDLLAIPSAKAVDRAARVSGKKLDGVPCSRCIHILLNVDAAKKKKRITQHPLTECKWALHSAIKRDDYAAFAEAHVIIDQKFEDVEHRAGKLLGDLQKLAELRNAILAVRDGADAAMRASPNASYFIRRMEANRKISQRDLRIEVFSRNGYTCVNCGATKHLSVDHIIPVVSGGTDDIDNLQTLCRRCNSIKGARSITTSPNSTTLWSSRP